MDVNGSALLVGLGSAVAPPPRVVQALLRNLTSGDIPRLISLWNFHRVLPQVYNALIQTKRDTSSVSIASEILGRLEPQLLLSTMNTRISERALTDLHRYTNGRLVAIKGQFFRDLYMSIGQTRQMADCDAYVPSEIFWQTIREAVINGYTLPRIRLSNSRHVPGYTGISPIKKQVASRLSQVADIHVGRFPSCGDASIPIDLGRVVRRSDHIALPCAEDAVLITLAHIARQGFCRLCDLNDIYLLSQLGPRLDARHLSLAIQDHGLVGISRSVTRLISSLIGYLPATWGPQSKRRLGLLDKMLLLEDRRESSKHADGVQFFISRAHQVAYLWNTSDQHKLLRRLQCVGESTLNLYRSGRAYSVWEDPSRSVGARIVLRPIAAFVRDKSHRELWQIADVLQSRLQSNPFDSWILAGGAGSGLVISRTMLLAQTNYAGSRPGTDNLWEQWNLLQRRLSTTGIECILRPVVRR